MSETDFVRLLGILQFSILIASALVPFQLDWKRELGGLPRLHYQMYFIYGGYVVLNIIAFGLLSICFAAEIASRAPFPRAFCGYVAIFWGIRLGLQGVMDAKPYLTKWWLKIGYHLLTIIFAILTLGYAYLAVF
jgi:polyferredoxin